MRSTKWPSSFELLYDFSHFCRMFMQDEDLGSYFVQLLNTELVSRQSVK